MSRETILRNRERRARAAKMPDGETLDDKIRRATVAAAQRGEALIPEPTLPEPGPVVDLATMTMVELHDLLYSAASTYLQSTVKSMPKRDARLHAERIANQGLLIARGQDYLHRGADPRG